MTYAFAMLAVSFSGALFCAAITALFGFANPATPIQYRIFMTTSFLLSAFSLMGVADAVLRDDLFLGMDSQMWAMVFLLSGSFLTWSYVILGLFRYRRRVKEGERRDVSHAADSQRILQGQATQTSVSASTKTTQDAKLDEIIDLLRERNKDA